MAKRPERYSKSRDAIAMGLWNALFVGESEAGEELLRRLAIVARDHPAEFSEEIAAAFTTMLDGIEKVRGWGEAQREETGAEASRPARVLPFAPRTRGAAPKGGAA